MKIDNRTTVNCFISAISIPKSSNLTCRWRNHFHRWKHYMGWGIAAELDSQLVHWRLELVSRTCLRLRQPELILLNDRLSYLGTSVGQQWRRHQSQHPLQTCPLLLQVNRYYFINIIILVYFGHHNATSKNNKTVDYKINSQCLKTDRVIDCHCQRALYKLALITFSVLQHPVYVHDFLTTHNPSRNLRSSPQQLLSVGYMLTASSSHCFKHSAAINWNDLPFDIRACDSVNVYKRKLKTHLFNVAYAT